jgi:hypothetical protein
VGGPQRCSKEEIEHKDAQRQDNDKKPEELRIFVQGGLFSYIAAWKTGRRSVREKRWKRKTGGRLTLGREGQLKPREEDDEEEDEADRTKRQMDGKGNLQVAL